MLPNGKVWKYDSHFSIKNVWNFLKCNKIQSKLISNNFLNQINLNKLNYHPVWRQESMFFFLKKNKIFSNILTLYRLRFSKNERKGRRKYWNLSISSRLTTHSLGRDYQCIFGWDGNCIENKILIISNNKNAKKEKKIKISNFRILKAEIESSDEFH